MKKEHKIEGKVDEKNRKILQFIPIPSSKNPYLSPALILLGNISKLTCDTSVTIYV